jgi:hypothetical protein
MYKLQHGDTEAGHTPEVRSSVARKWPIQPEDEIIFAFDNYVWPRTISAQRFTLEGFGLRRKCWQLKQSQTWGQTRGAPVPRVQEDACGPPDQEFG